MSRLQGNHFELFGLPARYSIDRSALDEAYGAVQTCVHPDHFAVADANQKQMAMQWATRANEAYRVLKDPLQRAIYCLHLQGIDVQTENSTSMSPAFLMQQLAWREQLEDATTSKNTPALKQLYETLLNSAATHFTQLAHQLDTHAHQEAVTGVRQLMFIERILDQTRAQLEQASDYSRANLI
jgi:molecular chaperone HscB